MNNTSDYIEITQLLNTFGTSIDQREWNTYETLFADEVDFDYSEIEGPKGVFTPKKIRGSAEEWLGAFVATQHVITNHIISIEGDEARCSTHVRAMHLQPNPQGEAFLEIGGHYAGTLVRVKSEWKIKSWKFDMFWSRGNVQLFELAQKIKVNFNS